MAKKRRKRKKTLRDQIPDVPPMKSILKGAVLVIGGVLGAEMAGKYAKSKAAGRYWVLELQAERGGTWDRRALAVKREELNEVIEQAKMAKKRGNIHDYRTRWVKLESGPV